MSPINDVFKRKSLSGRWAMAAAIWLFVIILAMVGITEFSNTQGLVGTPPLVWPAKSAIQPNRQKATLVLFAHPHCPCTRATLGELELLLAGCPAVMTTHVVFTQPGGTSEDWVMTDLWRKAESIPGVTVHRDTNGAEARRFNSETSGQTLLYDLDGHLLFQGGITVSRGHSGDNPGRTTLTALLRGKTSKSAQTPVFGCPLFETVFDGN